MPTYSWTGFPIGELVHGCRIEMELGRGANGVVYKAYHFKTRSYVAIKMYTKRDADGNKLCRSELNAQIKEIQLHYAASDTGPITDIQLEEIKPHVAKSTHPNIITPMDVREEEDYIAFFLPFCAAGNLVHNISKMQDSGIASPFVGKDVYIKQAFLQLLDAVRHCHQKEIFIRDLKPANILVDDNGDLLITDFGNARIGRHAEDASGTDPYMSPEVVAVVTGEKGLKKPFKLAPSDIWALGIILVELTTGRSLWKYACNDNEVYASYRSNTSRHSYFYENDDVSKELSQLLAKILHPNPKKRIKLKALREAIENCTTFHEQKTETPPPQRRSMFSRLIRWVQNH